MVLPWYFLEKNPTYHRILIINKLCINVQFRSVNRLITNCGGTVVLTNNYLIDNPWYLDDTSSTRYTMVHEQNNNNTVLP